MSARVLVVDDIMANVKLLEAKLTAEYFDVVTALSGQEALDLIEENHPDIILLDIMMPGMDGFEVCRRIKENPASTHIPVVMVTALDQPSDRVQGLECGADDFLTKPVNDIALFARVRSLVRLKMMTDELRLREDAGERLGVSAAGESLLENTPATGHILLVEDRPRAADRLADILPEGCTSVIEFDSDKVLSLARSGQFDLIVLSLSLENSDGLRLCSQIRSSEEARHLPLLMIVEDGDSSRLVKGLEIGVNDYLMRPVDSNEFVARVRTQLRRRRYSEQLRSDLQESVELAVIDSLTGLYNRRYLSGHLEQTMEKAGSTRKPISLLILDIDYFKVVNDTHGHQVGDEILKEFAKRVTSNVRNIDLPARYGGEEFVVVMPDTDSSFASVVAERLRSKIADVPFKADIPAGSLSVTVSIGVASVNGDVISVDALLKRADDALYHAKNTGRNRVVLNRRIAA